MSTSKNLTGHRFGRLVVVSATPSRSSKAIVWECLCDCGTTVYVSTGHLTHGDTQSCGCYRREQNHHRFFKHGMKSTSAWCRWNHMMHRCLDPKDPKYPLYGGRGITVCESWQDFRNFYCDMGDPPVGMSLDRKDTNGDYCKENCRWVTETEQQNNRRNNRYLEYEGCRLTIAQWTTKLGFKKSTIDNRLRRGWDIRRSLTTAVEKN